MKDLKIEKDDFVTGDRFLTDSSWENTSQHLNLPGSMREIGTPERRRAQVKQISLRPMLTCSGGKTRSPMGLLHILIYFRGPSFPSVPSESLSRISSRWVLTVEAPSKDSTCRSMETGYLPVTFCGKISSAADPCAFGFVRAFGIMWKDSPSSGAEFCEGGYHVSSFKEDRSILR